MDEKELADLIYRYGEERCSRRIARRIVEKRRNEPIMTTGALADIVRGAVPRSKDGIDPATRTFQALRIAVNDELGELERALEATGRILNSGGRMVVVSFHSLEDTIVKRDFREKAGQGGGVSRHLPDTGVHESASSSAFKLLTRKAVKPSEQEIYENARSRSARLRVIERCGG